MILPEFTIALKQTNREVADIAKITSSDDAHRIARSLFDPDTIEYRETFHAIFLNNANEVIGFTEISRGGITATLVDVRVIFMHALQLPCTAMILTHNHPSNGDQSNQDVTITEQIVEAGKVLSIRVFDHIIVKANGKFVSLADQGLI